MCSVSTTCDGLVETVSYKLIASKSCTVRAIIYSLHSTYISTVYQGTSITLCFPKLYPRQNFPRHLTVRSLVLCQTVSQVLTSSHFCANENSR